jgi:hypothetical protein
MWTAILSLISIIIIVMMICKEFEGRIGKLDRKDGDLK